MNDDFLKAYRKAPNPRFVEGLRKRLRDRAASPTRSWRYFFMRPMSVVAMVIVFLLALSLALPSARSVLAQSVNRIIAGIYVTERPVGPVETSFGRVEYNRIMSWSEVDQVLPFKFRMPNDMPQGYELLEAVPVMLPSQKDTNLPFSKWSAYAIWVKGGDSSQRIVLSADYYQTEHDEELLPTLPDDPSVIEEVEINGQPVALLCASKLGDARGVPRAESSCDGRIKMAWMDEGAKVVYTLEAEAGSATLPLLLQMVESIR